MDDILTDISECFYVRILFDKLEGLGLWICDRT